MSDDKTYYHEVMAGMRFARFVDGREVPLEFVVYKSDPCFVTIYEVHDCGTGEPRWTPIDQKQFSGNGSLEDFHRFIGEYV